MMKKKIVILVLGVILMSGALVPLVGLEENQLNPDVNDLSPDTNNQEYKVNPKKYSVSGEPGEIIQLTDNLFGDNTPQIDNGEVVWNGGAVMFYDGTSTTEIYDYDYGIESVQIDDGELVWTTALIDRELFYYDGSVHQLTNDPYDQYYPDKWADIDPQIDDGQIVWHKFDEYGEDCAVFLYTGSSTIQLTDYLYVHGRRLKPQISAGQVVWINYDRDDDDDINDLYFYDGASIEKIAHYADRPQIDAGQIVWEDDHSYGNREIMLYNGTTTIQLTNNSYNELNPQINAGQVVWQGFDGIDSEIFLYNGSSIIQLTNNSYNDFDPQISDGKVVWKGSDGHDFEIFLYTGTHNIQITDNEFIDQRPQIDNGQVVWEGYLESGAWSKEIFLYTFAEASGKPENPICHQEIMHNYLTWDEPLDDGGANIIEYNVYRGLVENGTKTFIGSSNTTSFNNTVVEGNTTYYYIVTAINGFGESSPSDEVSGTPRIMPFLVWISPDEYEEVILPIGDAVFNFRYDSGGLDDVELLINGINFGSVFVDGFEIESIVLTPYTKDIDGTANATLCGYQDGNNVVNDTRQFRFSKILIEEIEVVKSGEDYVGHQLYTILHDPNGDKSYSGYSHQRGLSIGFGSRATHGNETIANVGVSGRGSLIDKYLPIPVVSGGYDDSYNWIKKDSTVYDFAWEILETTSLTSSKDSSDPDYIGPGYGDIYWGEAWTIYWAFLIRNRVYLNTTQQYEEPELIWGIVVSSEVLLNDIEAPPAWRAMNPVHNNWSNVEWKNYYTKPGNNEYSSTIEVTTSEKKRLEHEITFNEETVTQFNLLLIGVGYSFTHIIESQWYTDSEVTDKYVTSYTLDDDETTDNIAVEYGIDKTFGTPIFRPVEMACQTSLPLEHNTRDYVPPIIDFPKITYDTSMDDIAPCIDDSPYITVGIFEESNVSTAIINYSINSGENWHIVNLNEQPANPGIWYVFMPSFDHLTEVLWYIKVWDTSGLVAARLNPLGNPYRYTVLNRIPTIEMLSPNGNESYLDEIVIAWTASDLDDDTLTYTLSYNLEGTGWRLLATGLTETTYTWSVSGLAYCETVYIRVEVDDGYGGMAFDECDYVFTVGTATTGSSTTTGTSAGLVIQNLEPMSLGLGMGLGGIVSVVAIILIFRKRLS